MAELDTLALNYSRQSLGFHSDGTLCRMTLAFYRALLAAFNAAP